MATMKGRRHKCYWHGCQNISPFVCQASVFGKAFGCGERFCLEHKGQFGMLFFQKVQFNDEDVFEEEETLCWDHIDDANSRTRWIFGVPFVILVLASVICLIFSIFGIVGAIGDVDFENGLEAVPVSE